MSPNSQGRYRRFENYLPRVGLTLLRMTSELCLRYRTLEKGLYFMKQIEEKFKRKVKYWLITYKQASGRDRLHLGLYSVLILVYMWWYFLLA
jgi:hypothetical protein